ncbi:HPr kinase/phosphorylase [Sinorhizobium sojae CCBAU 05684]|uniref:HPr kinase/phosphorylase n=1 Tax=Sinorhizobium sojae CCBAU 05684 TaxID=716928 RepID=A0A249PFW0_9HYPH|nr:serine kinase [Sinorhizobium sojae]ASY64833.1 HPr kinase/phosphorylase [Sinorhizobium sojae CCBAU 05684]
MTTSCNIHATAIVLGTSGFLVTGASGSGKSALALSLISQARRRGRFAALVADDRVDLALENGQIVARCPPAIRGLIEIRGAGIAAVDIVPACILDWAILPVKAPYEPRLPPEQERLQLQVGDGLPMIRLPVEGALSPLDALLAILPEKLGL